MTIRKNHIVAGIMASFLTLLIYSSCNHQKSETEQTTAHDTIPLTKHWESPIPHQEIPKGLISISATSCGSCHQDIYNEWKQSTHAVAFQDLQFQAELKKDNLLTCLNCHTPLQNQQEFIVKGFINGDYKTPLKEANPNFDKALQLESITCASCHVRDGHVIGTIGNTNAPHKTIKDVELLSQQLCVSCHNVVDELNPVLVCTFETGDEWANNWARKDGKSCISCHMPETERPLVPGMGNRKSHFHQFPGSGIPKFFDMEAERLESMEINGSEINKTYSVGETIVYEFEIKNSFAGHSIPTGDPERYFLITFHLLDSQGDTVRKEIHRIGEKWQWHPVAKKISDNNLKPLEERTYTFNSTIDRKGVFTLVAEITKHRMTEENAKHHEILGKYPLSIKVFKKQYNFTIE